MIYQIKLQYAFYVDAPSEAVAYEKAVKALREQPGSHISKIAQAAAPKKKTPFLMRVIKGV